MKRSTVPFLFRIVGIIKTKIIIILMTVISWIPALSAVAGPYVRNMNSGERPSKPLNSKFFLFHLVSMIRWGGGGIVGSIGSK